MGRRGRRVSLCPSDRCFLCILLFCRTSRPALCSLCLTAFVYACPILQNIPTRCSVAIDTIRADTKLSTGTPPYTTQAPVRSSSPLNLILTWLFAVVYMV